MIKAPTLEEIKRTLAELASRDHYPSDESEADDVPDYIAERVRRPAPANCSVIEGSTPVVSFGNVEKARVATLGLNPSRIEFADKKGWLTGSKRRLATTGWLGLDDLGTASDEAVARVVSECYDYFERDEADQWVRNPYWFWFRQLEDVMTVATDASYLNGTACHLDLVQWATDPVWANLSPKSVRDDLIEADREFLRQQLQCEHIRLVLINGKSVIEQVTAMGVDFSELDPAVGGGKSSKIVWGESDGTLFVGWSANLQSSAPPQTLKHAIAVRVRDVIQEKGAQPVTSDPLTTDGHIARGTTVHGKTQLVQLLRDWATSLPARTIGDAGNYGGKPWVDIDLNGTNIVLNADTKQDAVMAYLQHAKLHGPEHQWQVIANARGKVNKVVYRVDAELPGWYCYLAKPWPTTGTL